MSAYKECSTYKELKIFRLPADISFPFLFFFSAFFSSNPHKKPRIKKRIEISTRLGKLNEKAYLLARAVDALHQHAFNVGSL